MFGRMCTARSVLKMRWLIATGMRGKVIEFKRLYTNGPRPRSPQTCYFSKYTLKWSYHFHMTFSERRRETLYSEEAVVFIPTFGTCGNLPIVCETLNLAWTKTNCFIQFLQEEEAPSPKLIDKSCCKGYVDYG